MAFPNFLQRRPVIPLLLGVILFLFFLLNSAVYRLPFVSRDVLFHSMGTNENVIARQGVYLNEDASTHEKMLYANIPLKHRTNYIVEFEAAEESAGNEPTILTVDFCCLSPLYDKAEQEFTVSLDLKTPRKKIQKVLNALDIPHNAMFRIFHYSPHRVTISNVRLREVTVAGSATIYAAYFTMAIGFALLLYSLWAQRKQLYNSIMTLSGKLLSVRWFGEESGKLMVLYLAFVLIRFVIALLVQNPLIPTDELAYKNMAYSFFKTGNFYNTQPLGYFVALPNVLYPLLLSPSFHLGDNFYVGMKLINALLMNTAIFPTYLIARDFMHARRALLVSAIILLLPSLNYVNFIAVDGLNLPLFLFCFLFAYRSMGERQVLYAGLSGFSLALFFFNKPGAIGFLVGLVSTFLFLIIFFALKKDFLCVRKILRSLFMTLISLSLSFILVSLVLKGNVSYDLGVYNTIPSIMGPSRATASAILSMIFAFFTTSMFIYFLPFFVSAAAFFLIFRGRSADIGYQHIVFLALGFSLFIVYLLFTSRFMVTIYNQEAFSRLHVRYHYMSYTFFIISFAIFLEKIKWTPIKNLVLCASFLAVTLADIFYFMPKYTTLGLTIFDNPDLSWYVQPSSMIVVMSCLSILGFIIFLIFKKNRSPLPYLVSFAIILLTSNFGEMRNIVYYDTINSKRADFITRYVRGTIHDPNAAVVLIDSWIGDRLWTAFWLPYNYKAVYDLPKGSRVKKDLIPEGTQYIVLFDEYDFDFPVDRLTKNGSCAIILIK